MSDPTIHFSSKGHCIYCGATGTRLTDEHVVPYALGGKHLIDKASCDKCQKITGRIEQAVARGMWGDARIAFNAPTRRPRERPVQFSIPTTEAGQTPIVIPYADYPAAMVFYWMDRAGIFQGLPPDVDLSKLWILKAIFDKSKADNFHRQHPNRLVVRWRHEPENFARMLIKIGYCQVLTELNTSDFDEFATPYIVGNKPNPSFIVGGNPSAIPDMTFGYYLSTSGFGTIDQMVIVANVKLYSNLETPIYHIAVGQVSGAPRVRQLLAKLNTARGLTIIPQSTEGDDPTSYGTSTVWPIPYWP